MSNESDKIKHSRRLHQEEAAIKKQVKIAKTNGLTNKDIKEPHRLAKHHAMNCGDPKCMMCSNPRRTWKELKTPTSPAGNFDCIFSASNFPGEVNTFSNLPVCCWYS